VFVQHPSNPAGACLRCSGSQSFIAVELAPVIGKFG
jgi:hypothetical protein